MIEHQKYDEAVKTIKLAILQSQHAAIKSVNEKQLVLYFYIGKYISSNSRKNYWGKGAIDSISNQLNRELPGLRGFSGRNLRYMRSFYEEWKILDKSLNNNLALANAKIENGSEKNVCHMSIPDSLKISREHFFGIGFTQHRTIFEKTKNIDERCFYITQCSVNKFSVEELKESIWRDDFHHQGNLSNNFNQTIPETRQAFRAISAFKDEYLLDYINVEEFGIRDEEDIDEKIIENAVIHNVKNFILTFGNDFAFVRNQFHLGAFGENQFIDLLFFNRELNCLVAVELKKGKFKTSYLGQLSGYLSVLDEYEKKGHENPSIGIILCKDMNKAFVDFVIRDYTKPMGVATYKTSKEMSNKLMRALPDIDDLKNLLCK